mmetsp:Transcript_31496/g.77196  ORF Transcript_31496/g.77196 Transcript_31496/m.77196 type:complete len:402 (-) Transcript_31496:1743-2948(-)
MCALRGLPLAGTRKVLEEQLLARELGIAFKWGHPDLLTTVGGDLRAMGLGGDSDSQDPDYDREQDSDVTSSWDGQCSPEDVSEGEADLLVKDAASRLRSRADLTSQFDPQHPNKAPSLGPVTIERYSESRSAWVQDHGSPRSGGGGEEPEEHSDSDEQMSNTKDASGLGIGDAESNSRGSADSLGGSQSDDSSMEEEVWDERPHCWHKFDDANLPGKPQKKKKARRLPTGRSLLEPTLETAKKSAKKGSKVCFGTELPRVDLFPAPSLDDGTRPLRQAAAFAGVKNQRLHDFAESCVAKLAAVNALSPEHDNLPRANREEGTTCMQQLQGIFTGTRKISVPSTDEIRSLARSPLSPASFIDPTRQAHAKDAGSLQFKMTCQRGRTARPQRSAGQGPPGRRQ